VNCFQIVFLREESQVTEPLESSSPSCELLSNCIFTWGITSGIIGGYPCQGLWIAFKLYFYVRNHKFQNVSNVNITVVNCFQIVFLREESQGSGNIVNVFGSCELLSNCIFTWGITSNAVFRIIQKLLWIAFKLYFYVRNHKM